MVDRVSDQTEAEFETVRVALGDRRGGEPENDVDREAYAGLLVGARNGESFQDVLAWARQSSIANEETVMEARRELRRIGLLEVEGSRLRLAGRVRGSEPRHIADVIHLLE